MKPAKTRSPGARKQSGPNLNLVKFDNVYETELSVISLFYLSFVIIFETPLKTDAVQPSQKGSLLDELDGTRITTLKSYLRRPNSVMFA